MERGRQDDASPCQRCAASSYRINMSLAMPWSSGVVRTTKYTPLDKGRFLRSVRLMGTNWVPMAKGPGIVWLLINR